MSDCVMPDELAQYCDRLLHASEFQDYCPNGLQVDAAKPVQRIVSGVTASLAQIEAAAESGADLLLVHHGYFWKGEDQRLQGAKGRRIRALLASGISLLAYHLPLDAHAELGNNRQLAECLGFADAQPVDGEPLLWRGMLEKPLSGEALAAQMRSALTREPLLVAGHDRVVKSLAWCTGAAASYIEKAAALGVDAFITGEPSEPAVHTAREAGVHLYAAGHHATERFGVQALGAHLAEQFSIEHLYVDIDNPV